MPTVEEHCAVVPPLQRDHGLLGNQQEECIEELSKLGKDEQSYEQTAEARTVPVCWRTCGEEETLPSKVIQKHWNAADDTTPRKHGEKCIPTHC
mmetsp:Transcript_19649/g.52405  ORF Transcript_19649/g.52405 Transcript_19649/m.52405 type:complete len:94 (-) Transcript_19649:381-662(-)